MLGVVLALVAACCWGASDFGAGLISRRIPVVTVIVGVQLVGLAVAGVLVLASGDPFPHGGAVTGALLAGASGIAGLAIFYRALAVGTMSVVAPIAATGVALPLVVGVAGGDNPTAAQAVGLAATVAGVVLATREPSEGRVAQSRGAGLALLAAAGFGGYFIGAHAGARGGVPWLLLLSHAITIPLAVVALLAGRLVPVRRDDALALTGIGFFDLGATALYGLANRHGLLSIVAVVGSLYPVTTLILARRFLHERIASSQGVGIALALGGVALIAAG